MFIVAIVFGFLVASGLLAIVCMIAASTLFPGSGLDIVTAFLASAVAVAVGFALFGGKVGDGRVVRWLKSRGRL